VTTAGADRDSALAHDTDQTGERQRLSAAKLRLALAARESAFSCV
jgi:hypothetical protein